MGPSHVRQRKAPVLAREAHFVAQQDLVIIESALELRFDGDRNGRVDFDEAESVAQSAGV